MASRTSALELDWLFGKKVEAERDAAKATRSAAWKQPSCPGIAVRRTASLPLAYVPGIHVLLRRTAKTWMAGTSPAMTKNELLRTGAYFAATTMISTRYSGAASPASTVARAGVLPGDTHLSHTAFISAKFFMSVM